MPVLFLMGKGHAQKKKSTYPCDGLGFAFGVLPFSQFVHVKSISITD